VARHVRVQTLARYHEGVISDRRATRVAKHLTACRACAAASEQLTGVGALLARVEAAPMPARLADRIELALEAEHAARAASAPSASRQASTRRTWRLGAGDLTSPRLLRGLAGATGAALLVAGVSYVLVGADNSPAPVAASRPTAERSYNAGIVAPFGSAEPSFGPRQLSYTRHGKSYTYTALALNENVTLTDLAVKVRAHLPAAETKLRSTPMPATNAGPVKDVQNRDEIGGITISQLGGCLSRIAAGRQVLLAMVARYQSSPATIVVLRPTGDGAFLDVIVVGLACSASDADIITHTVTPVG
jgi:hypothetical protein